MTRHFDYETVDVFTKEPFGGNPLAVFIDARGLSSLEMQAIAREINYSETPFVLPPQRPRETSADAQLRIFTPTYEVPFAGHPNIGTAIVLGHRGSVLGKPVGRRIVFEQTAGVVPVDLVATSDGKLAATLEAPQALSTGRTIAAAQIASAAGIDAGAIASTTHPPMVISVGLPFVAVELADLAALARVDPRGNYRDFLPADRADAVIYYVRQTAATEGGKQTLGLRARMISPFDGVGEDPATGSANAALAALLLARAPASVETLLLEVEQGVEMGRPSNLTVTAERGGDKTPRVRVFGTAVQLMSGRLRA